MKKELIRSGASFESTIEFWKTVIKDNWMLVSGTADPDYGYMSISNDIVEQTEPCFKNGISALEKAEARLRDVVKVTDILSRALEFKRYWPALRTSLDGKIPTATLISTGLADPCMKITTEVIGLKS